MEPVLFHLIKSTALGLLFLISYMIFLRKETFFATNRIYLIIGVIISILLPFITLTKTVFIETHPISHDNFVVVGHSISVQPDAINWTALLLGLYLVGVLCFGIQFLRQLWHIKKIKLQSDVVQEDDIVHVRSQKRLSPFSFFKNIFYCPSQFAPQELKAIIIHEKVHAKQYHSLDVIFIQLMCIVLWFHPLVWIYREVMCQNLEFLADHSTLKQVPDKKQYQYLMLQQAVGIQKLAVTNSFYNSLIKKRITMLHQHQSRKTKLLKLFIVLPFLAIFLLAFNTKTVVKAKPIIKTETIIDQNKSFEYLITRTTPNEQLEQIKSELKNRGIDFSYTVVRNQDGEIMDMYLDTKGSNAAGVDFNMNFNTNSTTPIQDVVLTYTEENGSFYIGQKDNLGKKLKKVTKKIAPKVKQAKENVTIKISNVTLDIDKNTTTEDLKKDSKFLAERGVKINFKGIKRNTAGEITAIKVVYDNGNGDKGNYQQEKTEGITPFKIAITFDEDGLTTIDVMGTEKVHEHILNNNKAMVWISDDKDKVVEIKKHQKHNGTWILDDTQNIEIIELKKDRDAEVIMLNGAVVSPDSLTNIIKLKKNPSKAKRIKVAPKEFKGSHKKYIILETDSLHAKKFNKITIDLDESGDFQNSIKIVSKSGKAPLYVVDGNIEKEFNLKDLTPEQIKSVNVIKPEIAIEKYGDKGKNGVVEITTKKKE